jgi:uncharacterized sporulation protein YeaH/YhbH (DUF444 family)
MHRWPEYTAGTLSPLSVVQHDVTSQGEHLIWVWDGGRIHGPLSRATYDEAAILADVAAMAVPVESVERVESEPSAEVVTLRARVVALEAQVEAVAVERDDLRARVMELDQPVARDRKAVR